MYGKLFASTFTGSMFGAGPDVFATWAYIIANVRDSIVEINPVLLAAVVGSEAGKVSAAIEFLTAPDSHSRNPDHNGCRLMHEGGYQYRVVSHELYRNIRNEEDRRAYNRAAQQRSRAKKKEADMSTVTSLTVNDMSALSAHTEAEYRSRVQSTSSATRRRKLVSLKRPQKKRVRE